MPRSLVIRKGRSFRVLPPNKFFIDKNTPVGEDVDYYERKPFGGRKYIPIRDVLGFLESLPT